MSFVLEMKSWKDWLAVVLSVLALGGTFYRTGVFTNSVNNVIQNVNLLTDRVKSLENGASRGAEKHIQQDDLRDNLTSTQVSEQQKQISSLLEMKSKIAEMAAQQKGANDLVMEKLDNLKVALEAHKKQTQRTP